MTPSLLGSATMKHAEMLGGQEALYIDTRYGAVNMYCVRLLHPQICESSIVFPCFGAVLKGIVYCESLIVRQGLEHAHICKRSRRKC